MITIRLIRRRRLRKKTVAVRQKEVVEQALVAERIAVAMLLLKLMQMQGKRLKMHWIVK